MFNYNTNRMCPFNSKRKWKAQVHEKRKNQNQTFKLNPMHQTLPRRGQDANYQQPVPVHPPMDHQPQGGVQGIDQLLW